jgi:hypothetical protein
MANERKRSELAVNVCMVAASVFLAIVLARSGAFAALITATEGVRILGSFVAGFFFTSVLTTAPAIVAISLIAQSEPLPVVVFAGSLGAMLGDVALFSLLKQEAFSDFMHLFSHPKHRRLAKLFRTKLVCSLLALAGMVVIASPLPDELGLVLLGASRISVHLLAPISFVFNALGILVIAFVGRAVS